MNVSSTRRLTAEPTAATPRRRRAERTRPRIRLRGGPDGNEQLTAATGVILLILLAVLGVTILRIGQLISVHLATDAGHEAESVRVAPWTRWQRSTVSRKPGGLCHPPDVPAGSGVQAAAVM